MRLVSLNRNPAGNRLGKSIYNDRGKVLLSKGMELTEGLISRLQKYHVTTVYIEDQESEGIELIESIPEKMLLEAEATVTNSLQTIATLGSSKANLQGMMQSGRAMRSLQRVFKDLLGVLNENEQALNLLTTTKIQENDVFNHSLNVSIYACQLAINVGLPIKNIEEIGLGSLLHDIGKLQISKEVLHKNDKLTGDEYEIIKSHTTLGYDMIRQFHEIPIIVAHCALQHHERIDGSGYPRALQQNEIHPYAKIISVADVFDAVTSQRVYHTALLPHQGLELLQNGSGSQFDSNIVKSFEKCIAIYPQGLTVKLNDGRTGIVSNYNNNSAGRPILRIIRDEERVKVTPYEIDLSDVNYQSVEIIEAEAIL